VFLIISTFNIFVFYNYYLSSLSLSFLFIFLRRKKNIKRSGAREGVRDGRKLGLMAGNYENKEIQSLKAQP